MQRKYLIGVALFSGMLIGAPAFAQQSDGPPQIQSGPAVAPNAGAAPMPSTGTGQMNPSTGPAKMPEAGLKEDDRQKEADKDQPSVEGKKAAGESREKAADSKKVENQEKGDKPTGAGDDKKAADTPANKKNREATETERKAGEGHKSQVTIDSSQRSKVQTYFKEHKPNVRRVDRTAVSVSIGLALPATVELAPLPPDIVIVSGSCPIKYFLWGDDLVLVDSCSREVVDIIPDAA